MPQRKSVCSRSPATMFRNRRKESFGATSVFHLKNSFRGDDRKIIRWGLDLSGGKTVQIELRDQNNRLVTRRIRSQTRHQRTLQPRQQNGRFRSGDPQAGQ